ncbi:MAG: methyltransferase domain-containing protein [Actinobacteria bacterium]|nr:methyltransferase domain-containing protein [Actinomycetota bacterium]
MKKDFKKFSKGLLRIPYHKLGLGIKLNELLTNDLAQYFSLNRKEVIFYLKNSKKLNADLWNISSPKTEQEIRQFYAFTPYYIFALAYWHMKKYQRNLRQNILDNSFGDVLDYGAGIGDLCLDLSKEPRSSSVTYADIDGKTFNFAKWFFKKNNASIKVINLDKEKVQGQYDTIICVDVIEHVLDPKNLIKNLNNNLKNGGRLIITNLEIKEVSKQDPMHFGLKFDTKEYLQSLGLINKDFSWLWIKN